MTTAKICAISIALLWTGVSNAAVQVSFSSDESTVSVSGNGMPYDLVRPVVEPWDYTLPGGAREWHVAGSGSDANDGTQSGPLANLESALDSASAGDIIIMHAGRYDGPFTISKSGTAGKQLIITCADDALADVTLTVPQSSPDHTVIKCEAQYVTINGLIIEGAKGRPEATMNDDFGANGISFYGGSGKGCRITNCAVYGALHCGIKEMSHGGEHIEVTANVIFNNGEDGLDHGIYCPSDSMIMDGNCIMNNAGYGIHGYSTPKGHLITRNLILDNEAAGIILGGPDCMVYNNTCVSNGMGILLFRGGSVDNDIRNNILAHNDQNVGYDNGGGSYGDPTGNIFSYNVIYDGSVSPYVSLENTNIDEDPLFEDMAGGDYRLSDNSPARDAGEDMGFEFTDSDPDIGAFQYESPAVTIRTSDRSLPMVHSNPERSTGMHHIYDVSGRVNHRQRLSVGKILIVNRKRICSMRKNRILQMK